MEKIQNHWRILKEHNNIELFLFQYFILKELKNSVELKLVSIVQDINENVYDLKEEDFTFKFNGKIKTFDEYLEKVIINKINNDMWEYYGIKEWNHIISEPFYYFEDEICQECLKKWLTHLTFRTLNINKILFDKNQNNLINNWLVSIYFNTITPKITTNILNNETWLIEYEIFIYKHNCNDKNCSWNWKIFIEVNKFNYKWKEFIDKIELIKNINSLEKISLINEEILNPIDIEKKLKENIKKIIKNPKYIISKWDWTQWKLWNIILNEFEIDLNLWIN